MSRLSLDVLLLTLLLAVPLPAQEPGTQDSDYTERVSVTAARTPIPVAESGNSITILTRKQIEARGHALLGDLLRGLPGLSVSRFGPLGTQTQLRVRGSEANHVLVRVDGVDVSDAFGADELPLEIMTSDDIERIEFVRGPQSGLWGSDAVAGVINILTRTIRSSGGSARVEAGSFGTLHGSGRYTHATEQFQFDAGISHLDSDGTNISRVGSEKDGTRNTTASAGLRYEPSSGRFDLEMSARHTDSTSDFDAIDFVTTGLPTDAPNTTDTNLTLVRIDGHWRPEGGRWSHQATLSTVDTDTRTELGGIPDTSTRVDKLAASIQSSVRLGRGADPDRHGLAVALDHEVREFTQRGIASPFGDPNQDQEVDNTGLAIEYRFRARERWAASANIRHDANNDFEDVTTFRLTGSLGLQDGKTRLRAAAGTGQKAPTFIERFGFFPGSFIGNPNLHPERSTSFEIGVDRQFGERISLGATYFDARLENEINGFFFDVSAGGFTAVNETGESDRSGIELVISAGLGERADLDASYTYTDATQPDGAGASERELRRPANMATIAASWRTRGSRFRIRGALTHNGSATDLFFAPFPAPSQRVELDSYLLAELNTAFRVTKRLEVVGRIENLFDETYEDVFGFSASGTGAYVGLGFR